MSKPFSKLILLWLFWLKSLMIEFRSVLEGLYSHEEFVIGWNFVFRLESIIEVDSCYSAVCVNLYSLTLHKLGSECFFAIFFQVEDNFVPSVVQFQRHWTLKGFNTSDGLVIGWDEGSLYIFIIKYGDFEPEILIQLNYMDKIHFWQEVQGWAF